MINLSVVIITFNEEMNIERCIKSVKAIADEIIVVDSGSTDRTSEICNRLNVKFIHHEWEGYSNNKNFGNQQAKNDWILSLDADEELSEELIKSILAVKQKDKVDYYSINRLTNYCGKWIKHGGWYPDIKLRFFDRRYTYWNGIIHETLVSDKKVKPILLKGDCYHYTYYTISEHINQTNKFSELSALALFDKGEKSFLYKLLINPFLKFIKDYLFKLGFLDGYYGYFICKISAYATFLKYAKLKQLHSKKVVK